MIDAELLRFVRAEIKKQLNILLFGESGTNTEQVEDIDNMFHSMPTVKERPVVHPYGISSRAPKGTLSLVGQIGDHKGAKVVMGHRDKNRPTVAKEGEVILYDAYGHIVYLSQTKMQFGSKSSSEPMVLGNVIKACISAIMNDFLNAAQIGYDSFGLPVFLDPTIRTNLTTQKQTYITDDSTNIVSKMTFTERGQ